MTRDDKLRGNVARHIDIIRAQARASGWPEIRKCLSKGQTKLLSNKDRAQLIRVLDAEFRRTDAKPD